MARHSQAILLYWDKSITIARDSKVAKNQCNGFGKGPRRAEKSAIPWTSVRIFDRGSCAVPINIQEMERRLQFAIGPAKPLLGDTRFDCLATIPRSQDQSIAPENRRRAAKAVVPQGFLQLSGFAASGCGATSG